MASLQANLWNKLHVLDDKLDTDAFRIVFKRALEARAIYRPEATSMHDCVTRGIELELKKARRK